MVINQPIVTINKDVRSLAATGQNRRRKRVQGDRQLESQLHSSRVRGGAAQLVTVTILCFDVCVGCAPRLVSSSNGNCAAEACAAALEGAKSRLPTGDSPAATPVSVPSSGGLSNCASRHTLSEGSSSNHAHQRAQ